MNDEAWLARAVELATTNVGDGGGPFGAVIVRDGELLATGRNHVTRDLDPTAHAEVVAIRVACASLGDHRLTGCTIYASCEPCPMCLSASLWARVERIVYAADRDDAARAGFDDEEFYAMFDRPRSEWATVVQELRIPSAGEPFDAWLALETRHPY